MVSILHLKMEVCTDELQFRDFKLFYMHATGGFYFITNAY